MDGQNLKVLCQKFDTLMQESRRTYMGQHHSTKDWIRTAAWVSPAVAHNNQINLRARWYQAFKLQGTQWWSEHGYEAIPGETYEDQWALAKLEADRV